VKAWTWLVLLALAAGRSWLVLDARLEQRLDPPPGARVTAEGRVSSLPVRRTGMLEFRFTAEAVAGAADALSWPAEIPLDLPVEFLVRWYRDAPPLRAGSRWRLDMNVAPARARVNFQGPDRERWYFAQRIAALGVVSDGRPLPQGERREPAVLSWRDSLRDDIYRILDGHPATGLVLALALAERSAVDESDWALFRVTGTSHLLAISGMHVGLAAMTGFWLARAPAMLAPARIALRLGAFLPWFAASLLAFTYALLAGMGTSTRRALVMLGVLILLRLWRRNVGPWAGFLAALALVVIVDPLAVLGAGFWFSFCAVGVLLALFTPRTDRTGRLRDMFLAQCGIGLALAPLGILWFQQVSLLGFAGNLFAIPWVSIAVVPPLLFAALLMPMGGWLPAFLLLASAEALGVLARALEWLAGIAHGGWLETAAPGVTAAILAGLGGLMLLAPRGFPGRWLGLFLLLPLGLPAKRHGGLRVEMLDVGQGLAVLVETDTRLLLYDSGPGDGRSWSLVAPVILPALRQSARGHPDRVVVSHGDLDHAGGLHELADRFPRAEFLANLRRERAGVEPCRAPHTWEWDEAGFTVLHPAPGLPYLGNDSSCVISVAFDGRRVLLTGDVSGTVERRLASLGAGRHAVVFAPHHGSKTSSSDEFIAAFAPDISLVSSGYRNRFGFPSGEVRSRYAARGVPLLDTGECGAVEILIRPGAAPVLRSARNVRTAVWRWPPGERCP